MSDDEEEEWFYESIQRYDHLFMYELDCLPSSMTLSSDGKRLAVGGNDGYEIRIYSVPTKITAQCSIREGLTKNRDFDLIAGRTKLQMPFQDLKFTSKHNLVLLHQDSISLWTIKPGTDLLETMCQVNVPGCRRLACCSSNDKILVDGTDQILTLDETDLSTLHTCSFPTSSILSLYNERILTSSPDGVVEMYSINNGSPVCTSRFSIVPPPDFRLKDIRFLKTDSEFIAVFTSDDDRIHLRVMETTTQDSDLSGKDFRFAPDNRRLSIVTENRVKVVDDVGNVEFVHDGHRHPVVVHVWHPKAVNVIFSADSEKHLHVWKFKKKKKKKSSKS